MAIDKLALRRIFIVALLLAAFGCIGAFVWLRYRVPTPGNVRDEAKIAGLEAAHFKAADEDYFRDMDRNVTDQKLTSPTLTADEVRGRNTWLVWTAGNDRMWDELAVTSFGALDLVKTVSSHSSLGYGRDNRWEYLGLVNEPCFEASGGSDETYRFGLRLDRRRTSAGCGDDPFEDAEKYPGVRIGARASETLRWRGKDVEFGAGSYYGYATGVVGLRLLPNPNFDQAAADRWDPERYYTDPSYYNDRGVVRPYRVGMSCGFCHVGPNPINPPPDPNAPEWQHLSSNVGAQYFWVDRILYWQNKPGDFAFQLFHASRQGTLDTSFISTDNINNPRSMNAVYLLGPRLEQARRTGQEQLAGGGLHNKQFNSSEFAGKVGSGPLSQFFKAPDTVWTPRVLKDGSDSVGALGALNRVYLNIGTFSEEWLLHFNPLIGGKEVTPIEVETARRNSAYFAATEAQTLDTALYFLKTTDPHYLKDAPGGAADLSKTAGLVTTGRNVFADTCARCHSSKAPPAPPKVPNPGTCAARDYLTCWDEYFTWTEAPDFKAQMRQIVNDATFLDGNYLSSELRVPVTLLETNACSPLATNAIGGNIWDNFSSQYYKDLPSVGTIKWYHPVTGEENVYKMPAGGRGYTRPPSLVSLWSTAPFLLNNSVGPFESSPSVEARLRSFDASIRQMLWPDTRDKDSNPRVAAAAAAADTRGSLIDRVGDRLGDRDRTRSATITASTGFLPPTLQRAIGFLAPFFPRFFNEDGIRLGPIPAGTPIGLLSNILLRPETDDEDAREAHEDRVLRFARRFLGQPLDLTGQTEQSLTDVGELLELSKCPDLIVNRGHYFGSNLSDSDKEALIAFLKTF